MNQRAIMVAVLLFVLIVAGMFVFAYLSREGAGTTVETPEGTQTETPTPGVDPSKITRIEAKHYYADGVHTVAGELIAPSACDLLDWTPALLDGGKRVVISFDFKNNDGSCDPKPTPQRFKVGFKADKDAAIEAVFGGEPITLNLVPAKEGENPADFELFIKG